MSENQSNKSNPMPYDESQSEKLARKAKDAPFVPVGLTGLALALAYGAYKYKHRGGMSTSVFLMQLRVAAQGTVVSAMMAGLAYQMAQEYIFNPKSKDADLKKQ